MALGSTIKLLRKQQFIRQGELAKRCGLTQATISRLEKGRMKDVSSGALFRIARELRVTTDHLLGVTKKVEVKKTVLPKWEVDELIRSYQELNPDYRDLVLDYIVFLRKPPKSTRRYLKGKHVPLRLPA